MNTHIILRTYVPLLVFCMYLIRMKYDVKWFFRWLLVGLIAFTPLYSLLLISGFNVFDLISHSWRVWLSPVQYCLFILLVYRRYYVDTVDPGFSLTLAVQMACLSGYLYEAPRYVALQGLLGLFRFNVWSPFVLDYSIVAGVFVLCLLRGGGYVLRLLRGGGYVLRLRVLGFYLVYSVVYCMCFEWVHSLRYVYIYFCGFWVPWTCLYRVPTMLFLYYMVKPRTIENMEQN